MAERMSEDDDSLMDTEVERELCEMCNGYGDVMITDGPNVGQVKTCEECDGFGTIPKAV